MLFLGATDAGKSTLIRWLVERRGKEKLVTALVDADVGQSALCLPGTVGMAVFSGGGNAQEYNCTRFSFLGTPNPARVVNVLVETVGRYVQLARTEAELVLVDTTGLIEGELGIGLKLAKSRTTRADMVVVVQREDECEPLLGRLRNVMIHRLLRAHAAISRSQVTRAKRRTERLNAYFANACNEYIIYRNAAGFQLLGRGVSLGDIKLEEGAVIGLNRGEATIALGMVTEADRESVTFQTPLASLRGINRVMTGDIILCR